MTEEQEGEYRLAAIRKAVAGLCEGDCENTHGDHKGEVKVVLLDEEWGFWAYCENAIEKDRKSGFIVTEV